MHPLRLVLSHVAAWPSRHVCSRPTRWMLLVGAAVFMACREPLYLSRPRLWAEEGAVHLAGALALPWWKALFAIHAGYFALVPNVATLLAARVFPLEWAACVTTGFAFVVQLLPCAVIAAGRSRFWPTNAHRLLAIGAILCSWNTNEIWLNTITSQFWIGATAFLLFLLNDRVQSRRQHRIVCLLLVFCGLNGVVSLLLLPLFLIRAVLRRERRAFEQALALFAPLAIQLPVAWLSARGHTALTVDGLAFSERFFEFVIVRGVLRAFSDSDGAWHMMWHTSACVALVVLSTLVLGSRHGWRGIVTFAGGFLYTAVASLALATQRTPAPRYFFLPSVIVLALVVQAIQIPFPGRSPIAVVRSLLAGALLVLILRHTLDDYGPSVHDFVKRSWPRWPKEAAAFQRQPTYRPKIHPCLKGCWEIDVEAIRRAQQATQHRGQTTVREYPGLILGLQI
jgi:hypothetical protein